MDRLGRTIGFLALCIVVAPAAASAQGVWDAMLSIQPFPSPYYSDWDADPNIGSLTVLNHTPGAGSVRIFFTITDRTNRVIASGTSEPEAIPAGGIVVYDSPYSVSGASRHDAELERTAARTGRLPEGDYTACAAVADDSGFVLAESCADFHIVYPDPPLLIAPGDGSTVLPGDAPIFQWTPVHVPLQFDLSYVVRIVEVLPGQLPGEALAANIPLHEEFDPLGTSLRYPIDALPFEAGRRYAWTVRALDQNGYAASANEGRSEIWTFSVEDPAAPPSIPGGVRLTLHNTRNPRSSARAPAAPTTAYTELGRGGDESRITAPAPAMTATGLESICTTGSQPLEGIALPLEIPMILGDGVVFEGSATIYRETGTEDWAILARGERLSFLLRGECGRGIERLGGLQWLAVRLSGRVGDLMDGLELEPTGATELPLRFGVLIASLGSANTALPESFEQANEFLNFREIELRPGINLFGMVDVLREADDLPIGTFLRWAGYPDRYVELQGFAGLETSWSIGGSTSSDAWAMAELSRTRTILLLRAALPRRPARILPNYFESAQVGLQFEVSDSTGIQRGTGAQTQTDRNLIVSATLDLQANDSVRGGGSRWYGSFGYQRTTSHIDTARARIRALAPLAGSDTTKTGGMWILRLGVDELRFRAGSGPLPNVYLSGLELEIDLADIRNALLERDAGAASIDAIGTASIGVGALDDVAKVIVGIGRSGNAVRAAATADASLGGTPSAPMGPPPDQRTRQDARTDLVRPNEPRPRQDARTDLVRPSSNPAVDQAPRSDAPHLLEPGGVEPGRLRWGARVALGNMSLGELIALMRQGAGEAPP